MDINVLALAYIGDSIYEVYIRDYLIHQKIVKVNELQKQAIQYVSAKNQAKFLKEMLDQNMFTEEEMDILKTVLTIIFVIDCIALACIILLQEGKSAGLGTISGAADTYWGHNKGRSMEGALVKATRVIAVLFIVLAVVLNLNIFN